MIDRDRTIKEFGYDPDDLSKGSHKKVYAICDDCKNERIIIFQQYRSLCKSCVMSGDKNHNYGKKLSEKHKLKISKSKIGKKLSEEHKRKIGKSSLGKVHSEESKQKIRENHKDNSGDKHPNFGKHRSDKTKIKIREAQLGKKSYNWDPNITEEERRIKRNYPEYKEWRKIVYERDNYTCQVCRNDIGNNLNAHHLESYSSNKELRTTLSNGITLCISCHKNFHHQYGFNNTKKQFIEFLTRN